jgi:hypothetical protein
MIDKHMALIAAAANQDVEVRQTWQFFRDRRPETYNGISLS